LPHVVYVSTLYYMTISGPLRGEINTPADVVEQRQLLRAKIDEYRPEEVGHQTEDRSLEWANVSDPDDTSPEPGTLEVRPTVAFWENGSIVYLHGRPRGTDTVIGLGQITFFEMDDAAINPEPTITLNFDPYKGQSWRSKDVPDFLAMGIAALAAQPQPPVPSA